MAGRREDIATGMRHVALLLHYYQPPTQDPALVRSIDAECYLPSFSIFAETGARVTLNVCYSLLEHLERIGSRSIGMLREASGAELCESAAFHPILPLLPEEEIRRQLMLNREGSRRLLGDRPSGPRGVFPPEMAWSPDIAGVLAGMGYEWAVTDDRVWAATAGQVPFREVLECGGLGVLMRSNFWSNRIAFHPADGRKVAREVSAGLADWAASEGLSESGDSYLVIAMDGETFGHHTKGTLRSFLEPFILELDRLEGVRLSSLSEIFDLFPRRPVLVPPCSWSTTPEDAAGNVPFPLWDHPLNPTHTSMRKLRNTVLRLARQCTGSRVADLADRMLYSCPFWWASEGRVEPVQVRRGIMLMLHVAAEALQETGRRDLADEVMTAVGGIPLLTGRKPDAQEGKDLRREAGP